MTEPASPAEPVMPEPVPATPALRPPVLWPVLREMFSLLRRHWLRAFVLAGLSCVIVGLGCAVFSMLHYLIDRYSDHYLSWYWILSPVSLWLAVAPVGPVESGYWYAMYRLLMGEKVGAGGLFAGFRRSRLYLNLVAISLVMVAVPQVLYWIWAELPWQFCWEYYENIVTPGSPLDELVWSIPGIGWFISEFHFAGRTLILLPIQFSALVVFVGGKSWLGALAQSVILTFRHWRLALVLFAVMIAVSFDNWLRILLPSHYYYEGWMREVIWWVNFAGNSLIQWAKIAIEVTALVVVFREMLKCEAAAPPPECRPRALDSRGYVA